MKTVKMGEMTVLEVKEYLKTNKTIILPYGVVEQHGYHLPLDTDIRNAEIMGENWLHSLAVSLHRRLITVFLVVC
jgi:creatinine amidohydrolase/Fe(II)-dependent formamide hydrolase-like protein